MKALITITCPCCGQEILPVVTSEVQVEKDGQGRIIKWTETTKTDGAATQKRIDTYSYFLEGAVNQIEQRIYDGEDKLLKDKKITHFKDGKQPIVENVRECKCQKGGV